MKKAVFVLLVGIMVINIAGWGYAQSSFIIGTTAGFPPYTFQNEDGKFTGLATDIVEEVFQTMKVEYSIQKYPWVRALHMLTKGDLHALYTIGKTAERETLFYFPTEPLSYSKWVFFIRKEDAGTLKFQTLDDLKGKRIGLVLGYKYTPELWEFVKAWKNYDMVAKEELNFRKLAAGRVDYIISDYVTGMTLAKQLGISKKILALTQTPLETIPIYIAFSRTLVQQEMVDTFSAHLKTLKSGSKYQELYKKYIGE